MIHTAIMTWLTTAEADANCLSFSALPMNEAEAMMQVAHTFFAHSLAWR